MSSDSGFMRQRTRRPSTPALSRRTLKTPEAVWIAIGRLSFGPRGAEEHQLRRSGLRITTRQFRATAMLYVWALDGIGAAATLLRVADEVSRQTSHFENSSESRSATTTLVEKDSQAYGGKRGAFINRLIQSLGKGVSAKEMETELRKLINCRLFGLEEEDILRAGMGYRLL